MKNKKQLVNFLLSPIAGKKWSQPFFQGLYRLGLHGMNFNRGGNIHSSGELITLEYVKNSSKNKELVIFDVGANSGQYGQLVLNVFKDQPVKLYSFEPQQSAYTLLQDNLGSSSSVKLFNIGLSNKKETATIFSSVEGSTMASLHKRRLEHYNIEVETTSEVNLDTIDSFCEVHEIEVIDFLKIDVEGHELKTLQGAKRMIESGKIKRIQFEFGGASIDSRVFFQDFWYLLKDKYQINRIVQNGFYPINRYKEGCEIFLNVNYFAELKRD